VIVEIQPATSAEEVRALAGRVADNDDIDAWPVELAGRKFLVLSGDEDLVNQVDSPCVIGWHRTHPQGYWLVDKAAGVVPTTVEVGGFPVGGPDLWCAAGPCALESFDDALATARLVRQQHAHAFRIGVFKPRTSPYNFQGKGLSGLPLLAELKERSGLPVVTEVLDPRDVAPVSGVADCLQVGTRNMTNQALLKELGHAALPVLLKRGQSSSVTEWLRAAEFISTHGNPRIILCARGISSFDDSLRFMPDFGAIMNVRKRTKLPVVFDPSHSSGRRAAVAPVALAAAAFGIDGLLIESHIAPDRTYKPGDGPQAYPPDRLAELLDACATVLSLAKEIGIGEGDREDQR
jgi:3-deoxy-7-phosphoheptulonate synthase